MKQNKTWKVLALSAVAVFASGAAAYGAAHAGAAGTVEETAITIAADATTGIIGLQMNDKLTLGENEYLEMKVDFADMTDAAVIDMVFQPERARKGSEIDISEGVSVYADTGWMRGVLNSSSATTLTSTWGSSEAAGQACGLQWVNGNSMLGAVKLADHAYSFRTRIYDNGTVLIADADVGSTNWFTCGVVGYVLENWVWKEDVGITVPDAGYPTIMLRNAPTATITGLEVATYEYTEIVTQSGEFADGTLSGEKYVETFDAETTSLRVVSGTATKKVTAYETSTLFDGTVMDGSLKADGDKGGLLLHPDAGWGIPMLTLDQKYTIGENQYAEIVYDLSGVTGSFIDVKFTAEKPTDVNSFGFGSGEGMMMINDGRIGIYSESATNWLDGWGNDRTVGDYCWANFVNGNGQLGAVAGADSLRLRARIYCDGTASYGLATAGQDNWFNVAYVGASHNGTQFVPRTGYSVISSGYFTIAFRNTALPVLTAVSAGVYDVTEVNVELNGTLNGEAYSGITGEGSKLLMVSGTSEFADVDTCYAVNGNADTASFVDDGGLVATADATTGAFAFVTENAVTLAENQYVETYIDVKGLGSAPFFDFRYAETKPADALAACENAFEGVSYKAEIGGAVACAYSERATQYMKAWNQIFAVDGTTYSGTQYVNGDSKLGALKRYNGESDGLAIVARYYYDGTFILGVADTGNTNWFYDIYVGWQCDGSTGWSFVQNDGLKAMTSVYPQILIRNQPNDITINAMSVKVYTLDGVIVDATNGVYNGTFASEAALSVVGGSTENNSHLIIEDGAAEDVVYSLFTLPANIATATVEYALGVESTTGDASAAMYFGATDKSLAGAEKVNFTVVDGKVSVSYGETVYASTIPAGSKFSLALVGNEGGYALTVNGTDTGITLASDLSSTVVAFATEGVNETDHAAFKFYGVKVVGYAADVTESEFSPAIKPYPEKLSAPEVTVSEDGVASWGAIDGAIGYKYYIVGEDETYTVTETSVELTLGQTIKVKALGDGDDYLDGDYSEGVTYTEKEPESESESESDAESTEPVEGSDTAPATSEKKKGGCIGSVGAIGAFTAALFAAAAIFARKREE